MLKLRDFCKNAISVINEVISMSQNALDSTSNSDTRRQKISNKNTTFDEKQNMSTHNHEVVRASSPSTIS